MPPSHHGANFTARRRYGIDIAANHRRQAEVDKRGRAGLKHLGGMCENAAVCVEENLRHAARRRKQSYIGISNIHGIDPDGLAGNNSHLVEDLRVIDIVRSLFWHFKFHSRNFFLIFFRLQVWIHRNLSASVPDSALVESSRTQKKLGLARPVAETDLSDFVFELPGRQGLAVGAYLQGADRLACRFIANHGFVMPRVCASTSGRKRPYFVSPKGIVSREMSSLPDCLKGKAHEEKRGLIL